jgi:hypothetical protein
MEKDEYYFAVSLLAYIAELYFLAGILLFFSVVYLIFN